MFLRDVVLVEANSPLSRFGVHGMRDPAGIIADMLFVSGAIDMCYYHKGFALLMRDREELVVRTDLGEELARIKDTGAVDLRLTTALCRLTITGKSSRSPEGTTLMLWRDTEITIGGAYPLVLHPDADGLIRDGAHHWRIPFAAVVHVEEQSSQRLTVLFQDGRIKRCRFLSELPEAELIR